MIKIMLLPLARKHIKLIISLILICSLNIALMVGLSSASSSFEETVNKFIDKYQYSDIVYITNELSQYIPSQIELIDGVKSAFGRICYDAVIKCPDGSYKSVKGFTFTDEDFLKFYVFEGKKPESSGIMISQRFAEESNLSIGDEIMVNLGNDWYTDKIDSIISSTETIAERPYESINIDNKDYGYIYINRLNLATTKYYNRCNQIVVKLDSPSDSDKVLNEIENVIGKENIINKAFFEKSNVKIKAQNNIDAVRNIKNNMPKVFFVIVQIVQFLLISIAVKQDRREIGILRGFGYEKLRIRAMFCLEISIITVLSTVLGVLISIILSNYVVKGFASYLMIEEYLKDINFRALIYCFLITLFFNNLSTLLSTVEVDRVSPAEAFRRNTNNEAQVPAFIQNSRLSSLTKVNLYGLIRSKSRFVLTVFCFAASIAMILTSLLFKDSIDEIVNNLFEDRLTYDVQLLFREVPDKTTLDFLSVTEDDVSYLYQSVISYGDKEIETKVEAVGPHYSSQKIIDLNDEIIGYPSDGIILSNLQAQELGVSAGDTVYVDGIPFTVENISKQMTMMTQYISSSSCILLGDPVCVSICCNCKDKNKLISYLAESDNYLLSYFTQNIKDVIVERNDLYLVPISIVIVFAIAIGVIIMVSTLRSVIIDRKKDLSVLRTLGFSMGEISVDFFKINAVQYLISLPLGLFAGIKIAKFVCDGFGNSNDHFEMILKPGTILISTLISLVFLLIGHFISMRSIKMLNLTEELKERD